MKLWIVEDEPWAAKRLEQMLQHARPNIVVEYLIDSVAELQQKLSQLAAPDLILSDIELLDGKALTAYQKHPPKCPVIFTTAYEQYLLQAFQTNGIGYLLKPFEQQDLEAALNKYQQLCAQDQFSQALQQILQLHSPAPPAKFKQRLTIKRAQGLELLPLQQVACLKLELSGLYAYDMTGKAFPLAEQALGTLESQLDPAQFFRLNRTELVNLDAIRKVLPYGKDRLEIQVQAQQQPLICSAQKTPAFRRWLEG
jgi:DNA-binding LytR/AlgR family response regulator